MIWKINLFIFLLACSCQAVQGQQAPAKADSSGIYRNIETFSNKGKVTKFLYGLFFKPVTASPPGPHRKIKKQLQKSYSIFQGKIIRNIEITTLDPFGYSIADTIDISQNFLFRAGNELHVKTQHITIRNLLLIHRNEPFDSLLAKESERLIRSQKYVHDVSFYVAAPKHTPDSVDVFIRVIDVWSIIPEGSITASHINFDLTDKNFLGFGHEFSNAYSWNHTDGADAFSTKYIIPNIRNTYISTTVQYAIDEYKNFKKSLSIDRAFYSPLAKWAGGITFGQQFQKDSILFHDSAYVVRDYKFNTQDYWAGKSWQAFKGTTVDDRTTNLILSARFLRVRYLEKPFALYDSLHFYSNEDFYLSGIGVSRRKYVQDKYIFNYGVTEDVPVGNIYGLTGGYQVKNNTGRLYTGIRVSFGNYNEWGYLSCNFEYGTFFHTSHLEEGVFTAGVNYFTGLFEIGKWKFRQFVKPQLTIGFNRFAYENITINNENGIRGFSSPALAGTKKIILTLQSQSYSPWNILGFRFGPYLIYSAGMLGDAITGFKKSRVYSQIELGVLIKNEFLVFDIFQVSLAFYPIIPGSGENIFKLNPNSTADFGFRDFEIGEPATTVFQ